MICNEKALHHRHHAMNRAMMKWISSYAARVEYSTTFPLTAMTSFYPDSLERGLRALMTLSAVVLKQAHASLPTSAVLA